MANSVVKVTDITEDTINDSLLLLVGEDGTVTPDRQTVDKYLSSKAGPTNLQIMHIDKSNQKGIDVVVDNVMYVPDDMQIVNEDFASKSDNKDDVHTVAANLYNVKLDHDYTPLTSPGQSPVAEDDDELAKTLSILHGNSDNEESIVTAVSPKVSGKNNKTINIISSITIPPGKSSSVALTTPVNQSLVKTQENISSAIKHKGRTKILQFTPKVGQKPVRKSTEVLQEPKEKNLNDQESVMEEEEDEDDDDDNDELNFEIDDDENDTDFDIKKELGAKKLKTIKPRKRKKLLNESNIQEKTIKILKPVRSTRRSVQNEPNIDESQEKVTSETTTSEKSPADKPQNKNDEVERQNDNKDAEGKMDDSNIKSAEKKIPKKKKEPPKPIPGDFALFSTPDIIRKVGGKEQPTTPETPTSSKPGKITQESRSKSMETSKSRLSFDEKDKPRQRTSTDSKGKSRRDSLEKVKQSKKGLERRMSDTCKSSVKGDKTDSSCAKSSLDLLTPQDVRSIIMPEETTNTIAVQDTPSMSNSDGNGLNLDASGLDLDQSILDNINNDMISEDILYQVAKQLVSNTELQNAIDKGINEGVLDTSSIQEAMDNMSHISQSSNNSSFSESQQSDVIKEGTQIVRPDGRIVVLPPIERPTTRSRNKKKEEVVKPPFKEPSTIVDPHRNRMVRKPLDDEHVSGNELDSSGGEGEEESEDDPNKLWCICNQPHNNRFMICCDTCEEWYHGKCVNITKAMGQQMEEEGKEWICLFCKDPSLKRPMAAARRIRKASRNSRQSTDSSGSSIKIERSSITCVVCHKPARKNSIYCSENCILTHAHGIERVVVFERATGKMLTGNKAPSAAELDQFLKDHPGYEVVKSAGKIVTTKTKPGQLSQSKLKIVKNQHNEGVSLAVQKKGVNVGVMAHAPKHQPITPKSGKIPQKDSKIKLIHAQPMPQMSKMKEQQQLATPKKIQVQTMLAPKMPAKENQPKKEIPKKEVGKEIKPIKMPRSRTREDAPTLHAKSEDIRDNVQKTIFEQLTVRLKDSEIKLTEDEIKNISTEIEAELYKCFGDTGQKYKNKYRSLIFNIKDPKNQTLWRRICEKSISSYELVRLSPDDMASQELAKWREQEAKHQLDMIKKSEIELLNCNRQYVLKTHKGEEVLEDNPKGNKIDNTEIIKSLTEGSSLDTGTGSERTTSKDRDRNKEKKGGSKHSRKDRSKERHSSKERKDSHKNRRSSSRERDRSRRRSKSRSRHEKKKEKRSRSRSRESRDKNRERYKKSSHKSSRHKKSTTISSTEGLDKRSKEILEQLNKIAPPVEDRLWKHVPQEDIIPGNTQLDSDSDHEVPSSTVTIPTPPRVQDIEDLTTQSSENSKSSGKSKEIETGDEQSAVSPPMKNTTTEIWSGTINMVDVAQISITAHEVSGDCTGLNKELSPNLDIVGRISPETVWEYIGKMRSSNSKIISLIRLNATNVEEQMPYLALYSYLSSRSRLGVVKSTNKAIKDFYILPLASNKPIPQALLPISGPGFEEARPALLLGIIVRDKRKRSYVDVMPPSVTPSHKKSRIEVHVVQTPPARSYTPPPVSADVTPSPPIPKVDPRLAKHGLPLLPETPTEELPASIMSIVKPSSLASPVCKSLDVETKNDDDEPYSPEDSDPDTTVAEVQVPAAILSTSTAITVTSVTTEAYVPIPGLGDVSDELSAKKLDIQRQMEELNKKIEMQKSEISSMTKNIVATQADPEMVGSALANIALPSNLQQILDSIKTIGTTSLGTEPPNLPVPEPTSISEAANDLTIPLMIPKTFARPLPSTSDHNPPETIPLNLPTKIKLTPPVLNSPKREEKSTSVLSSLSEEDLIKKAAEMLKDEENGASQKEITPPPPPISYSSAKKQKMDVSLPPVPGVDD
ncbi:hypothetical protein ABEB36_008130 [Hypothenemus hampei]|uniref:Death-inducer obliterator 1 n=1 Tax=Hypothenemus hampei TaxID=57062 RepID=A0ABD1EKU5_HYPHA